MIMKNIILTFLTTLSTLNFYSQELLSPSNTFSHEKSAYITLTDSAEIVGNIDDIDRKKGLIEFIKIIDKKGTVFNLKPEEILHMYIPPSGFDKIQKTAGLMTDVQKWTDEKINKDLLNNGYAYFESLDVQLKKENATLLIQLLNPTFSKYVKIYYDPFASETSSIKMGGIKLTGGQAKSYYVSKNGETAFKLKKKNYEDEFIPLWHNCEAVIENFPKKKWSNLTQHIITYSNFKNK